MTVDEYAGKIRHQLVEAGFQFDHPNPGIAWVVFKKLAAESVECDRSYLFFEAADGKDDLVPGYFDYVREFQHHTDNGAAYFEQVTIAFQNVVPLACVACAPIAVHSEDFPDHEAFFKAVEDRLEFRTGLAFTCWSAEVRIDGC